MPLPQKMFFRQPFDDALAAALWFDPTLHQLEALKSLLGSAPSALQVESRGTVPNSVSGDKASGSGPSSPAATLLRHAVFIAPSPVRPYFAVCALEAWRRVSVRQLAGWSGIPLSLLKRRLAAAGLTPAGVAAWNLALHATWLLDVVELPASAVVRCMGLGRPAALAALLGARGVRFCSGEVDSGAFAITLERYLALLRAAFRA